MRRGNMRQFVRFRLCVAGVVLGTLIGVAGCSPTGGGGEGAESHKPAPVVAITAAGGDQVNPTTPIDVSVRNGKLTAVTVTNPDGKQVAGQMADGQASWRTTEVLAYDKVYDVTATVVDGDGKTSTERKAIHTLAPTAQAYPSVVPAPSTHDLGVGQPIVVRFDHSIKDRAAAEKALQISSTPNQPGGWYWLSDKEVHYRPQNYWQPGTKVSLKINFYGVDLGGGVYGQTDRSIDFAVHDSWIAKADGNTEQMQIFHNGQLVNTMPISLGKDVTPTHVGAHVISDKQQKYTMDSCTYGVCPPDPNAYRSDEFFAERISNDGEFVHENPASVAQQGSANVSHGCINLDQANAQWFFDHFGLGDVVEVTNSGGPALPVWDTYGDWSLSWDKWKAGSALH
ncbi:lipoprotein-anchoring transpeptidase ErfK/SrfK [Saccharopolyspora spinosa]|uniref:Lipoprotein-anchoring transpeptidase ErfK/SrfK n=2 Tax=Saccharopolyspora spinosa TaxID=60894 RepID=A0A2N3XVH9_SACSN|nr:lipoprotein-anchoring transpeptidase ErfK/SrfK [Saccharopolyspora spinosa]